MRRHWLEAAWAIGGLGCLGVVAWGSAGETVPFHLVWIGLTIVYAIRLWSTVPIVLVLAATTTLSTFALAIAVARGQEEPMDLAEVPLMAGIFVGMIWHARRRQAAIEAVRRAAARELAAERERNLVFDAAHGLRTPLTVARGHAERIAGEYPGTAAAADAAVVLEEIDRVVEISEGILLLAAADSPGFLRVEHVDVAQLLHAALRRWHGAAERVWSIEAAPALTVCADARRLSTALDALIENAVKFTAVGETITIAAREDRAEVVIEVRDEGTGIAADHLPRVFERFERFDAHHTGAGLGLAIVKAIAEAHRGTVEAESTPGWGSVFRLRVPATGLDHSDEREAASAGALATFG